VHNNQSRTYDSLIIRVNKIEGDYLIDLNLKNNFGDEIKGFSPKLFCIK
jgi:hypothetical protein